MKHPNLKSYIDTLRREGELRVVEEEVNPCLELAEIQRRTVAKQGPALLFTRVLGTRFPVATNLFGTRRRIELAFGEGPERFVRRLAQAAETLMPARMGDLFRFRDLAATALRLGAHTSRTGPVLENCIQPPRLRELPQIQNWPGDGGPFLTLPLVYTEHPSTGKGNLGMYRNQIFDDHTLGMHIQIHRGGGFHHHAAERQNQALPVNLFLGGPPALTISAIAPLPENVPELALASLLQGGRLHLVRDPGVSPLPVVAEADFLFVGQIPPHLRKLEGPFGDHYGYYSLAHDYPVFDVAKIYHRKGAIFPATVVGRPRQEDHYIGEYLQDLFSPVFPLVMNGVVRVWAYDDAGVHPLAAAVVRERYRRESFMAALRILGEGQLSLTKVLIATDALLDLKDFRKVLVHVLERADFNTDLFVLSNISQDTLDYSSRKLNEGSKAVLLGMGEARFTLAAEPRAAFERSAFQRPEGLRTRSTRGFGARVARRGRCRPPIASGRGRSALPPGLPGGRRCRCRARRFFVPLDRVHPLRTGCRHPRTNRRDPPLPRRVQRPAHSRLPRQALVPACGRATRRHGCTRRCSLAPDLRSALKNVLRRSASLASGCSGELYPREAPRDPPTQPGSRMPTETGPKP